MYSPQTSFAGAGHYHRKMQLSKSRNQVTANQGTAVTAAEPRDREGEHSSMHPETLMDQVKEIRERILKHGESLRWNEMQTRYALIDPLLQALGWNTADPTQVVPEFHWGRSAADYALFGSLSRPLVVIEAKSLHTPLQEHVSQAINYCLQDGIEYFAITDGGTWELYETHRRGALAEKMVTSLDVRGSTPVAEVCLNALALWRPMVQTGKAVVPPAPIADLPQPETQGTPCPSCPDHVSRVADDGGVGSNPRYSRSRGNPVPRRFDCPKCILEFDTSLDCEMAREQRSSQRKPLPC